VRSAEEDVLTSPSIAALMVAQARCADVTVTSRSVGTATQLLCPDHPFKVRYNRAFDVDAREPGTPATLLHHARRAETRPLLEVLPESLDDTTRAALVALGLSPLWKVVALRVDTRSLPAPAVVSVPVRRAVPAEALAFGALAVRAYGPAPPGFPSVDSAGEARLWSAFCASGQARCFFAEVEGAPVAIGMSVHAGEVALVDGAATLAEHRRRGCQGALLAHRLDDAQAAGATVAITRTGAASASQRNLERAGMRVYQTREVWGVPA